jgi:hypothetical protein
MHGPSESNCDEDEDRDQLYDCDLGSDSKIYYHHTEQPGTGTDQFFDYWFFYRFNAGPGPSTTDDHEGDWEGVFVAAPKDDPTHFHYAAFNAHNDGPWRYLREVLLCGGSDSVAPTTCGSEGSPNAEQRINVYVANGSHASYPFACTSDCRQTDEDGSASAPFGVEGDFDGQLYWAQNDTDSALEEFPEGSSWDDPENRTTTAWTDWPGLWGHHAGSEADLSGPHGPGTKGDRWTDPWSAWTCTERGTSEELLDCWGLVDNPSLQAPEPSLTSNLAADSPGQEFAVTSAAAHTEKTDASCAAWRGPGTQLVACDPAVLEQAQETGAIGNQTSPTLEGAPVGTRVGQVPGLVQAVGPALKPGEILTVGPKIADKEHVFVRTKDRYGIHAREVFFDDLRPGEKAQLKVHKDSRGRAQLNHDSRPIPVDRSA